MKSSDKRYFMIRAMRQSDADFDIFFGKNVVAVGWSKVNFSDHQDSGEIARVVETVYYSDEKTAPQVVGKKKNEVVRFKGILPGDRILVPHYDKVCFALAGSKEIYDVSATVAERDLANQRSVEYLSIGKVRYEIPRKELSEGLQRRLSVRGTTISDLNEFSADLAPFWEGKMEGMSAWDMSLAKAREISVKTFRDCLLHNIQFGHTKLQAGGRGLELLVKELLECEGYSARVLPKTTFQSFGDADVIASRADRILGEQRLLVQVKHHRGSTGNWGAKQLTEIQNNQPDEYKDCQLILVTSGEPSEELASTCDNQGVTLIAGHELVAWIHEMLPKLDMKTKDRLGILDTPKLKSETGEGNL